MQHPPPHWCPHQGPDPIQEELTMLREVVEAVEKHRLHMGPVGKDQEGERAPGGFIYVNGCWCASCTAEAYRRRFGG